MELLLYTLVLPQQVTCLFKRLAELAAIGFRDKTKAELITCIMAAALAVLVVLAALALARDTIWILAIGTLTLPELTAGILLDGLLPSY